MFVFSDISVYLHQDFIQKTMRVIIEPNYQSLSQWAANYVANKINAAKPTPEKPFVLGCPTGSSPLGMYKALVELNKQGKAHGDNHLSA